MEDDISASADTSNPSCIRSVIIKFLLDTTMSKYKELAKKEPTEDSAVGVVCFLVGITLPVGALFKAM